MRRERRALEGMRQQFETELMAARGEVAKAQHAVEGEGQRPLVIACLPTCLHHSIHTPAPPAVACPQSLLLQTKCLLPFFEPMHPITHHATHSGGGARAWPGGGGALHAGCGL